MIRVFIAPREHYGWLAQRAQLVIGPGFEALEAVDEKGRIVAMVGADGWSPASCALHVAVEYPAALRHLIKPAFGLVFDGLGKDLVVATVLSTNARSLKLVRHLGFKETHRIRGWWEKGVDAVMFEMRRRDCRWVSEKPEALREVG